MALTKAVTSHLSSQTATVSDATAQTNAETISDSYSTILNITIAQVGAASSAATFTVWVRTASGIWVALWEAVPAGTAEDTYYWSIPIPFAYGAVGVAYTAQSGGTSSTINVDVIEVTALE